MKKLLLGLCTLLCINASGQLNKNLTLRAHYPFPGGVRLANICGYAKSGNEYALVGTSQGMTIINVTNPSSPVKIADIPGPSSIWREIKVWKDYAYVTTEGGGGLQIVDLTSLPSSSVPYKSWTGTGAITGLLNSIHALHIDNGYVYLFGTNIDNKGAIIASLSDPWNPVYTGKFDQSPTQLGYIHDGFVRNDTLWGCHIYAGYFSAINVADKSNPVQLATQTTPSMFTHNSWLSDNSSILYTTDETAGSYLASYDVSDVNDIQELDRIRFNNSNSIVHNTHIYNDYAVNSWYTDGVVIVDGLRPDNLVIVGNYDTSPLSGAGYDGCWGVYPFLPSRTVIAADIDEGLFILTPKYVRGCYLEGTVKDSTTNLPINDAIVEIMGAPAVKDSSKSTGIYKTGIADSGSYIVKYSKSGYKSRVYKNVKLDNAVLVIKNVKLFAGSGVDTVSFTPDSVVSIPDFINRPETVSPALSAYPNPSTSAVTFKYKAIESRCRLVIRDILGKTVKTISLSQNEETIRLTDYMVPGIYFVRIEGSGGASETIKLIRQ